MIKSKWLHLSDIHFLYKDYQTNWLRKNFIKTLKGHAETGAFKFVFITGDITDKNSGYPEGIIDFVDDILNTLKLEHSSLFIVPGNHDMDYTKVNKEFIKQLETAGDAAQDIVKNLKNEDVSEKISVQASFFNFYKIIKGENYPIDRIHFSKRIDGVNIIHINTSWLNGITDNERKIFIGLKWLYNELSDLNPTPDSLNIVIGHHSINCIHKKDQEQLRGLFKDFNIDFYLSGHVHEALINYDSHIDTHFCICRQMRDYEYPAGYAIGNIDTLRGDNHIEFYSWNDKGYWTLDNNVGHAAPYGTYKMNSTKFPANNAENSFIVIHKTMTIPENEYILLEELGFSNVPVCTYPFSNLEIKTAEEWLEHKQHTYSFTNGIINRQDNNVLHVFPLSQIPLLIYMGYLFQDDSKIKVYQKDEDKNWVLSNTQAKVLDISTTLVKKSNIGRKLVVAIEASGNVSSSDIEFHVPLEENSLLRISINPAERYEVLYQSQVEQFKKTIRKNVERHLGDCDEIHLFAAVPAGLAVEIGRIIMKNMWPKVFLYNYKATINPKYQYAYTIND